jgi:hypothetical protein
MSEESESSSFRSQFQCPICLDLLVKPTLLHGCGHSFCSLCLHAFVSGGGTRCPECRTEIKAAPSAPCLAMERALLALLGSYAPPAEVQLHAQRVQAAELRLRGLPDMWKRFQGKQPNYDKEDEVYRCLECQWEVNQRDGHCTNCDEVYPSVVRPPGSDDDDEEEEEEEEEEDSSEDDEA